MLDPATRSLAARAVYRHDWDDASTRREADAAVAQAMHFREAMLRKLPVDKRAEFLAKAVRPNDGLAGSLLLALHLEHRRALLRHLLDALGIPHADGLIDKAHDLVAPGSAALESATESLYAKFPEAEVSVYLATLYALDPEAWAALEEIQKRREARG